MNEMTTKDYLAAIAKRPPMEIADALAEAKQMSAALYMAKLKPVEQDVGACQSRLNNLAKEITRAWSTIRKLESEIVELKTKLNKQFPAIRKELRELQAQLEEKGRAIATQAKSVDRR